LKSHRFVVPENYKTLVIYGVEPMVKLSIGKQASTKYNGKVFHRRNLHSEVVKTDYRPPHVIRLFDQNTSVSSPEGPPHSAAI
jgi:hypothetical protein